MVDGGCEVRWWWMEGKWKGRKKRELDGMDRLLCWSMEPTTDAAPSLPPQCEATGVAVGVGTIR